MNILFVCTANVSRSFLAEQLFRQEAGRAGIPGVAAASAGVMDFSGNPPDSVMVEHLFRQKIPYQKHESRGVDAELMEWADRVLVMESAHLEALREQFPECEEKLALLGTYVSPDDRPVEILDPFGLSAYHYRTAISQITLAVKHLVQRLAGE
jgi:protein-tyrosine phosphatase